jgi:hypothetical protein
VRLFRHAPERRGRRQHDCMCVRFEIMHEVQPAIGRGQCRRLAQESESRLRNTRSTKPHSAQHSSCDSHCSPASHDHHLYCKIRQVPQSSPSHAARRKTWVSTCEQNKLELYLVFLLRASKTVRNALGQLRARTHTILLFRMRRSSRVTCPYAVAHIPQFLPCSHHLLFRLETHHARAHTRFVSVLCYLACVLVGARALCVIHALTLMRRNAIQGSPFRPYRGASKKSACNLMQHERMVCPFLYQAS